jgi:PAS domain S-box-containing protein
MVMTTSKTHSPPGHPRPESGNRGPLRASELRYRRLFESARDGILILDAETGQVVDANPFLTELLGLSRADFLGRKLWELGCFHDVAANAAKFAELQAREYVRYEDLPLETADGQVREVEFVSNVYLEDGKRVIQCNIRDITARKRVEVYRDMQQDILEILNERGDGGGILPRVLALLKTKSGVDAVGIRLQEGDDFPYVCQDGFSEAFLQTENSLIERGMDGGVCRDDEGNVCLDCTCGLVLRGETDPANPLFSRGGSAWTNDSSCVLDLPPGEDPRHRPRNQCIHSGYASVALVPIRDKERTVGLLQLNDHRMGGFSPEVIEVLEGIASHVGSALMRTRAEQKLLMQSMLLEAQKEDSPDGILAVDNEGHALLSNARFAEIWRIPKNIMDTRDDKAMMEYVEKQLEAPEDFSKTVAYLHEHKEEKHRDEVQFRDGRCLDRYSSPLKDAEGLIQGRIWYFRDITERKRQEARIEHQNRVLHAIRDVNQLINHETDRDTLLRRACETLIATRGYRSAWVALRDADGRLEAVSESGVGEAFAAVRRAMERGGWPECCQRVLEHTDGIVAMHDRAHTCRDCALARTYRDTGALAGGLRHGERDYGVLVVALPAGLADDAEEKSLFRELVDDVAYALHAMENAQKHREEEARFRSYVESAPYGIFITDRSGHFIDANPAAGTITGYSRDELLTLSISDLVSPDGRERGLRHFQTLLESGRSDGEIDYVRSDGEIRQWRVLAVAQGPERFLGFVDDITERRRAEAEREKLQSQLVQAQKMESVGRLAGGVAHDFNNLLMGIIGYVELCRDGMPAEHPVRGWLDEITHEAERSANLTRQLLAFARKQTIAPQVIDLDDAVSAMLKLLRRLIGEDIDLTWQPCGDVWPVKLDPGQLDQILVNLCVNARDAVTGVGRVSIQTANATIDEAYCSEHAGVGPGMYVMLAVSDDGRGMDRETLVGLGLATVYGIAKQNGGFVNVYSEPGIGTTFRTYLPRVPGEHGGCQDAGVKEERVGGSETVLLVEDEKSVRVTTALFLERLGYTVWSAERADAALRTVDEHPGPVHLLITDVIMPGMSGRDLADELTSTHPSLKVLYISGYTANVIAHRGILDADVAFLPKPFTRDDLARKVRKVLDE